ncbi:hypothetical protein Tco_0887220, partial [Tanacetum coccineum]
QSMKTLIPNTGVYNCQVDEQWFDLSADLLIKALAITPVNPTHPFELPPSADMGRVYSRDPDIFLTQSKPQSQSEEPKEERIYYLASNNNIHRRPDSAVHHTGDDYILGNLKFVPKGESVEVFGMAIPDPLITEAIQQSSYYPKYLKMVAENTKKTPQESASMQPATKRATPKKPTTTTPVKQSKPTPSPTKKPSKRKLPQKVRRGKPTFQLVDEDDEARQDDDPDLDLAKKLSLEAHQEKGEEEGNDADLERAIKLSLDPTFLPQGRAPVGGVTIRDPVSETTSKLHEVVGKGKAVVSEEQVAHSLIDLSKKKRTTDQFILVRRDQTPPDSTTGPSSQPEDDTSEKVIHESSSTSDSERTESETEAAAPKGDKYQDEVDTCIVTSGVSIPVSDPEKAHEALTGPDPEPMKEDQTGSDSGKLHVSLAGPNPEHMDDEFLATAYPKVHEKLKLITDERVIDDKPESHFGSMSSMKNLDDTFNFGDQFLHDKPTEDDQEKSKVREESDSTIPDPSQQTVMSTPPVIAPFTNVSSTKPSSLDITPPINTEAITITTSLPEITPFIALQLRDWINQGKSSKRRRHDSGASGSAQPPTKDDEQSSKKPRGGLIPESEHSENLQMTFQDRMKKDDSDMEDTDNAHIPKVSTLVVKPIPEARRLVLADDRKKKLAKTMILEGTALNIVKAFHRHVLSFNIQMEGPTGQENYSTTIHLQQGSGFSYDSEREYDSSTIADANSQCDQCQEKLNHLPKTDKTSLHTAVNMWIRNLDAADYYFKEDYTIVPKPIVVVYRDRNDQRKLTRLNELHKFSDGTLTRVMEKLDHMVKDFNCRVQ